MTRLERARKHLIVSQWKLYDIRTTPQMWNHPEIAIKYFEDAYLAALTWVWEEQEKSGYNEEWELEHYNRVMLG